MPSVTLLQTLVGHMLDFVLPPRCHGCGVKSTDNNRFCPICWSNLTLVTHPACWRCDLPFAFAAADGERLICAACQARPPAFDWAVMPMLYDEASSPHLLRFKHGRVTPLARPLAQLMAARLLATGRLAGGEPWLLVPIPLHQKRFRYRRFNQSHRLAVALKQTLEQAAPSLVLTLAPTLLVRTRATRSQGGLSRAGRYRNLAGALRPSLAARDPIVRQRILVVDDVFTTGATVETAARSLLRAGAREVGVVCAARVPGPR